MILPERLLGLDRLQTSSLTKRKLFLFLIICFYCLTTSILFVLHHYSKEKKLKIVNCCGFDCIPCDLGAQMIVEEAQKRGCTNVQEVRFLADKMKGGASGGTMASVFNILESLSMSELLELLNPFYLNPRDPSTSKPEVPHDNKALIAQSSDNTVMGFDSVTRSWTIPYVMQAIDTRFVNRSNALSGYKYGRTFVFSERMIVPNFLVALAGSVAMSVFQLMVLVPFTRYFIKQVVPKPGQGPSQDMLDTGFFTAKLWAKARNATTGEDVLVRASVQAYNGDPGYRYALFSYTIGAPHSCRYRQFRFRCTFSFSFS